MTQPIEDAITAIVAVIAAVPGIQQVPLNPPETINVTTFGLVYAESGDIGINAMGQNSLGAVGARASFHTIAIYILTARTDLSQNLSFIKPFADAIPAALLAQAAPGGGMFGGKLTTFGRIHYEQVNPRYAGVMYTGYYFTINDAKILIDT